MRFRVFHLLGIYLDLLIKQIESTLPFENFVWEYWSTFQENPFSQENFRSGITKLVFPFTFHPKFAQFLGNGKQP